MKRQICNIEKSRTTAYHPQCDGLVERFNRTLKHMLATSLKDHPFDWEDRLRKVCMAYNTSVHASTGYTPFYLMFGMEARLPIDIACYSDEALTGRCNLNTHTGHKVSYTTRRFTENFMQVVTSYGSTTQPFHLVSQGSFITLGLDHTEFRRRFPMLTAESRKFMARNLHRLSTSIGLSCVHREPDYPSLDNRKKTSSQSGHTNQIKWNLWMMTTLQ